MDAAQSLHPTDQTLSSYGLGKLDDRSAEAVNEHLMECSDCRKRVAEMSADSFLQRVRDAQKPSGKSTPGKSQVGGTLSDKETNDSGPPPTETLVSELVNHPDYDIKRELGRGGMGVVYLAHNTMMGRDEVLKVMGQHLMDHPGVLERFLREIQSVAKLRHPNIVTAYHATRFGQSVIFAMEYVEGLDLSKLVKSKGPMPVAHACLFIHQAALGLQHAYEKGLVHRDIKPHNLMLSREGNKATVKILDFGLAKAAREGKVEGGLTATGQALGTPDYIAPEQIINAPTADIRADIYSLGGTLYYLLAGHPPFQEKSLYDLYQAHISRIADPLNLVRPDVPAELAALVAKMLAKDPSQRFQTPGDVAQAMKPFCTKANAALKTVKAGVSQADHAKSGRSMADAASAATQIETDAERQTVRPGKPSLSVAESRWESIVDFRETEPATEREPSVSSERRRPRAFWPIVIAASFIGLFAFGVVVITIKNQNGKTTITVSGDPAIEDKRGGKNIEQDHSKSGPETVGNTTADASGPKPQTLPTTPNRMPPAGPARLARVVRGGLWTIAGDELVKEGLGDGQVSFGDPGWTDYDLTFEARKSAGPEGFGGGFRGGDGRSYFYQIGHLNNSRHYLCRYMNLGHQISEVRSCPGSIRVLEWYKVKISLRGHQIRIELDNHLLFACKDGFSQKGSVGLRFYNSAGRFRNIKVTAPDGTVLWEGPPDLPEAPKKVP